MQFPWSDKIEKFKTHGLGAEDDPAKRRKLGLDGECENVEPPAIQPWDTMAFNIPAVVEPPAIQCWDTSLIGVINGSTAASSSSSEVCPFYLKGWCGFGDQCMKAHTGTPAPKEICPYHAKGHCGFGDECIKSHDNAAATPVEVCPFFLQGFCSFGDQCAKAHALAAAPVAPIPAVMLEACKFHANGYCGFGDKCLRSHDPNAAKGKGKQNKSAPSSGGGSYVAKRKQEDISVVIEIPAKRVKDLMGVHGNNIRKIQQMSGVYKIKILDEQSKERDPDDMIAVEIRGNAPATEVAKKMVDQICSGDQSCIGNIEDSIELEPRLVSKIIGTGGEVIQHMQKQTGCRLAVRSGERGTNQLPKLIMIGTPENVLQAKTMVGEYMRQHADRPSQDTHIDVEQLKEQEDIPWPWLRPGWTGADPADVAANAAASLMNPAAAPTPEPIDFAAASAAAMQYAQTMAAMQMQQYMEAMQQQASAVETATAAAAAVEDKKKVAAGAAKLGTSLRDKLMANRKKAQS